MKRFIASAGALVLATAMLASCSAYNNPEKYITVPELSSVSISQADMDKTLQEQIEEIREASRKENFSEVSEAAKLGDQVNIDYEGKLADSSVTVSEETLSGMKAEKQDLILGSGSMVGEYTDKDGNVVNKGFEEQIIGMKAGESKDITVTFPDSYSNATELQGKEVIFTIKVHTVSRLTVDENCLVKVEYAFTEPEESKDDVSAQSEESTDDTKSDTTGDSELNKDEEKEDTHKFTDLFEDGDFEIDYTAEADADEKFNEIFKVADYRDLFKGAALYEEIEHTVTVPDDADDDFKSYAGKDIKVTFKVDSATILPEWNDEFVKEYTDESFTTVTAYQESLMKDIKMNAAYEALMEVITVDEYPESETEKLYKQYVDQLIEEAAGSSLDELTADELNELVDDATYAEIRASAASQSMTTVKERLVWEYLIDKLDVSLSKDEYKDALSAEYEDYAANYMYYYYYYYGVMFSSADDLESYYGKDTLELQFKFNKVMELLPEHVTVTE